MHSEIKICENCKNPFTIEPEDFAFYEKIHVPPPTWCPECRMVRRMNWRNERALYHGECHATGKKVLTEYAPEASITTYHRDYWWSDAWGQLASGREYDFSKPFFLQCNELLKAAPLPNVENTNVVDSEYGNHNVDCKSCYLTFASFTNEHVAYSNGIMYGKDSLDLYVGERIEQSYEDVVCADVYRVSFSHAADQSMDSLFLKRCRNLQSCIGCVNLRNKKFHIFNKPYTQDDYQKEVENFNLGSYKNLCEFRERFRRFALPYPCRHASIDPKCVDVTGDNIMNSKNSHLIFDVYGGVENSKFATRIVDMKDSYDGYGFGAKAELLYEGVDSGIDASRCMCTVYTHHCHNVHYTYCCHSSSNLFACIGLRNKSYCILNKQYTKEEYEALVPKIIDHMNAMPYTDAKGRIYKYGEFFPPELSPFCYNETIAQEYFPLTKAEALKQGYRWKDPEARNYNIDIKTKDIPDDIKDVQEDIIGKVIECEHASTHVLVSCNEQCTEAFKIIPQELEFYRKMNLPLPRFCPNCRHYQRLKQRNPLKLWHRRCMCGGILATTNSQQPTTYNNTANHRHGTTPCTEEFETSYAPERQEIVYCENCYNQELA